MPGGADDGGTMNKKLNLDSMSVDEMWQLHEEISRILSLRLTSEKRELEKRLDQLRHEKQTPSSNDVKDIDRAPRRKYPRVDPKYQNPQEPHETWSVRNVVMRLMVSYVLSWRAPRDSLPAGP